MSELRSSDPLNRRRFLGAAGFASAGAALSTMPSAAGEMAKPDPLITEVQDWARYPGDGVDIAFIGCVEIRAGARLCRRRRWLPVARIIGRHAVEAIRVARDAAERS